MPGSGNDLRLGFELAVPLFGKGAETEAAAVAQTRAAAADEATLGTQVDAQLVVAYHTLNAATSRARVLAGEAVPAQTQAAALARTAYREGRGGLADVLVADRALTEVEVELVDSLAAAALARAAPATAVGGAL